MIIILLIPTIINFIIFGMIKNINNDVVNIIIILINYLITNILVLNIKHLKHKKMLLCSFFIRIAFMFFDLYGNSILYLPNSGADSVGFYLAGLNYMNISLIQNNLYGGIYSKYIGFIFKFIGDKLIFIQYVNVLFSIFTIIFTIYIFEHLKVNNKDQKKLVFIESFLPMNVILSCINLRESIIVFFVTLSLYNFIKYNLYERLNLILKSFISLIVASAFHSGVFFIGIGYLFSVLFKRANKLSFKKIFSIAIVSIVLVATLANSNIFLDKLSNINIESIGLYDSDAGSLYLANVKTNSLFKILTLGWLKAIYLYVSPTPLYWRGINDIITFIFDSSIYIYLLGNIILNRRKLLSVNKDNLTLSLLISFLAVSLVFGVGTIAAGTAIRHRNKILPLLLIMNSLAYRKNYKLFNYYNV